MSKEFEKFLRNHPLTTFYVIGFSIVALMWLFAVMVSVTPETRLYLLFWFIGFPIIVGSILAVVQVAFFYIQFKFRIRKSKTN